MSREDNKQKKSTELYYCPLTGKLMIDPVTTADGQNYERTAIEAYFETGMSSSPVTAKPLAHRDLAPNEVLRDEIQAFQEQSDQDKNLLVELEQLKANSQKLKALAAEKNNLIEKLTNQRNIIKSEETDLETALEKSQARRRELTQLLGQAKTDKKNITKALESQTSEITELQAQLENLKADTGQLQRENKKLLGKLDQKRGVLQREAEKQVRLRSEMQRYILEPENILFPGLDYAKGSLGEPLLFQPTRRFDAKEHEDGIVRMLGILPGNKIVFAIGSFAADRLEIFYLSNGAHIRTIELYADDVCILPNGDIAALGDRQGYPDTKTTTSIRILDAHGIRKKDIKIKYDWLKGRGRARAPGANCLRAIDDQKVLCQIAENLLILDYETESIVKNLQIAERIGKLTRVYPIVLSNGYIVAVVSGNKIKIWNDTLTTCMHTLEGKGGICYLTALSNGRFATATDAPPSHKRGIEIWDSETGCCERILQGGHTTPIVNLIATLSGIVISSGGDKTIRFWQPETGECIHVLRTEEMVSPYSLNIMPDGRVVGVMPKLVNGRRANLPSTIAIWNFPSLEPTARSAHAQRANPGVFSSGRNSPGAPTTTTSGSPAPAQITSVSSCTN